MKINNHDEFRAVSNLFNRLNECTIGDYKNLPEDIRKKFMDLVDYCQESINECINREKEISKSHFM